MGMMFFKTLKYLFKKDPYITDDAFNSDNTKLHLIIFSKNRACQLDSLLRSINDNFNYKPFSVSVLYKFSNMDFECGYRKTIKKNILPELNWINETNFKHDVINIITSIDNNDLIMFLVDDDIFIKKIDPAFLIKKFHSDHLFISLRASRSYIKDSEQPTFLKMNDYLEWEWKIKRKRSNTWNYPFSVDGNIYHAVRIKQVVKDIDFSAPNSFESAMHDYRKVRWIRNIKKAVSPMEPVVVNNPLNRVQVEGKTWHTNIDPEYINNKYLKGMVFDNSKLYNSRPTDTHYDFGVLFVEGLL